MSIVFKNVSKSYNNIKAVNNISIDINKGQIIGFLGPNGAGKTTTLKMIATYIKPDAGNIFINDINILNNPNKVREFIGYLPETNSLYYDMRVIEFLNFIGKIQNIKGVYLQERLNYIIDACGLTSEINKRISQLSKGYKQRVGIAHSLIHNPEILILDEPTSGLDPNQIIEIRSLIRNLGKEKTIIFSSHILQEVDAISDRIIIINKGEIIADASPIELKAQTEKEKKIKIVFDNSFNEDILIKIKANKSINSIEYNKESGEYIVKTFDNLNARREIFNTCRENNFVIMQMQLAESKLEDIFMNLTNK